MAGAPVWPLSPAGRNCHPGIDVFFFSPNNFRKDVLPRNTIMHWWWHSRAMETHCVGWKDKESKQNKMENGEKRRKGGDTEKRFKIKNKLEKIIHAYK